MADRREVSNLKGLHTIARAINSNISLPSLLQLITDTVCEYSEWSMCEIVVVDKPAGIARLVARHDPTTDRPDLLRSWKLDESVTAYVVARGTPLAVRDARETDEAQYPHVRGDALKRGYGGVLVVPLPLPDAPGALWIFSREPHDFTKEQIEHAQAIADHVAIAINNSRLYQKQRESIAKLERLVADQTTLMRDVLSGQALPVLLRSLEAVLGNPVAVIDRLSGRISLPAGSAPDAGHGPQKGAWLDILHALEPETLAADEWAPRKRVSESVQVVHARELGFDLDCRVQVMPLTAVGQHLGYLLVPEIGRLFDELDRVLIEQAGLATTVNLMHRYVRLQVESRFSADFLSQLFTDQVEDRYETIQRAHVFGLDLTQPNAVFMAQVEPQHDPAIDGVGKVVSYLALSTRVGNALRQRWPGVVCVIDRADLMLIVPAATATPAQLRTLADIALQEFRRAAGNHDVRLVVGPTCRDLGDYGRAWRQCSWALQVAALEGRTGIVGSDDLGLYQLVLSNGDPVVLRSFVDERLGAISAYDTKHRAELLKTLQTFLDQKGSLERTAEALFIHVSSLRYRLKRIESIGNVHLGDGEARFWLQLALRIRSFLQSSGRAELPRAVVTAPAVERPGN